ncbi:MAG: beta-galactosidase [Clostridia bacterium]|nr:beta-galactosidase [Clostridia bacterium]
MKEEYHPIKESGEREYGQGSFGFLNYFHPEVEELICAHYRAAALAYKDFPALVGYDIFNETMFRSFDEYTLRAFRDWLREKYQTIERLNEVWERTYSDWDQICFEKWKWMSIVPQADYAMFRKASVGIFLKTWKTAIEEVDRSHLIIADNIHSTVSPSCNYGRPQDDFDLKRTVGNIGMSFYPKGMGGTLPVARRWEIFDGFFAASGRDGFLISEMQTHIQSLFNYNTCVRPYELKQWCYEAYAGGANGLIYWMWRPFDAGLQLLGRGLVDYQGNPTERYDTARNIGQALCSLGVMKPRPGRVGVLYDPLNDDYSRAIVDEYAYAVDNNLYLLSLFGAYKAMFDANVACDMVTWEELEKYKAVILSNQIVMDKSRAEKLCAYVENGGTVIIDGRFGIIGDTASTLPQLPGGEANQLCGTAYLDADYEGLSFTYKDEAIGGYFGRELMQVTDGEVLSEFADGFPAVVRKKHGKGTVLSFHTHVWYGYGKGEAPSHGKIAKLLADEFSLRTFCVEGNVKVRVCENEDACVLFLFNYSDEEQAAKITLDGTALEVSVAANDCVILRMDGSVVI